MERETLLELIQPTQPRLFSNNPLRTDDFPRAALNSRVTDEHPINAFGKHIRMEHDAEKASQFFAFLSMIGMKSGACLIVVCASPNINSTRLASASKLGTGAPVGKKTRRASRR